MSLGALLLQGGWPMLPIYACSLVALTVFFKKWRELGDRRLRDDSWLAPVLEQLRAGRLQDARSDLEGRDHPAARAIAAALVVVDRRPDRALPEAGRVGTLELIRLERHLGLLSFVARVAPLLGLLGTVVGMVGLFLDLEGAGQMGVDVSRLSSGIWTALLTTAAGLAVAVPTLAAHSYLSARADHIRLLMLDAVDRAITSLPMPVPRPAGPADVS